VEGTIGSRKRGVIGRAAVRHGCGHVAATKVGVAAATTAAATAVVSTSPALVPAASDQVVVDIADDDALPQVGANGETGPRQPPSLWRGCW
jgi:hypothetical protein